MVGAIIGRSGGTIRQITQQSRARVDVHRKENAGALEKVITIYGNPENCSLACQKILEVMQTESNNTNRGEIPLKILAHNNLIGRIIGKGGNTIKRIMEQTDTKIAVSRYNIESFLIESFLRLLIIDINSNLPIGTPVNLSHFLWDQSHTLTLGGTLVNWNTSLNGTVFPSPKCVPNKQVFVH